MSTVKTQLDKPDASAVAYPKSSSVPHTDVASAIEAIDTRLAVVEADYSNDMEGPASSTDGGFAKFDGVTGKLLKDSAATVAVVDGGTGRTTGTTAYALVATGTTATGAQQTLASGATTEVLVGGGAAALPVWTTATGSGAPVRATSPTVTTPTISGVLSADATTSVAAPPYTFTSDTDTGIGHPAADTITVSTGGSERVRVDSSGNVGIGTTAPASILELKASAYGTLGPVLTITNGANGTSDAEAVYFKSGSDLRAGIKSTVETGPPYNGSLEFLTGIGTLTERMRISPTGNVGIGTTAPGAVLDVVQNQNGNTTARIYNANAGASAKSVLQFGNDLSSVLASVYINSSAAADANALVFGNGTSAPIILSNNGTENMRVASGGAITFPNVSTTASAANAFLDSGASNNLLRSTSSRRYKTDIEGLDPEFAKRFLEGARPVYYRSLAAADDPANSYWGVIAEELAEIDPRLVHWSYSPDDYTEVDEPYEKPVTTDVSTDETTITVIDGKAVETTVTRVTKIPVYDEFPMVDAAGQPLLDAEGVQRIHRQPRTETKSNFVRKLREGAVKVPDGVQYERFSVMLLAAVQYLWRDRVTSDVPFKAPDTYTLDDTKNDYKSRVDRDAESVRMKYLSLGAGMSMTYQEKFVQAQAVAAMGEAASGTLTPAEREAQFPTLSASVGIEAPTLWGCAQIVLTKFAQFAALSMHIERTRLSAKAAIRAATTVDGVRAAYAAATWPAA